MRHVKTVSHGWIDGPRNCPVQCQYTFKHPTPNRSYVKVLRFVESHPGCKRKDIQRAIWGREFSCGSNSTLFANMLYADILDYNSKFEYRVTRKGKNILRKVAKMK